MSWNLRQRSGPRQATHARRMMPAVVTATIAAVCAQQQRLTASPKQASEERSRQGAAAWRHSSRGTTHQTQLPERQAATAETPDRPRRHQYVPPKLAKKQTDQIIYRETAPSISPSHPIPLTMTLSSGGCDPLCTQHASAPRHMSTMKPTPTTGEAKNERTFYGQPRHV